MRVDVKGTRSEVSKGTARFLLRSSWVFPAHPRPHSTGMAQKFWEWVQGAGGCWNWNLNHSHEKSSHCQVEGGTLGFPLESEFQFIPHSPIEAPIEFAGLDLKKIKSILSGTRFSS